MRQQHQEDTMRTIKPKLAMRRPKNILTFIMLFVVLPLSGKFFLGPDHDRIAETRRRLGIQAKGAKQSSDEFGRKVWRHEDHQPDPDISRALLALDRTPKIRKGREEGNA